MKDKILNSLFLQAILLLAGIGALAALVVSFIPPHYLTY